MLRLLIFLDATTAAQKAANAQQSERYRFDPGAKAEQDSWWSSWWRGGENQMPQDSVAHLDPDRTRPTALVVEDETFTRLAAADGLRQAGFVVIEAGNAREALDVVYSSAAVDVVVADIRLPGALDGLAVVRIAKIARPSLHIVIASATPEEAAGLADAVFPKPYDAAALAERIRSLLGGAE
jgi:CheY-like chemotaxis protein